MTARNQEVLHQIVEAYIRTGEPVASRTIARLRGNSLSAASIRNVMADLDEQGYLSQPHTSAGRIPTEKAFRSYIASLTLRRIASGELDRLRSQLTRLDTVGARVEHSSHMLTEMTRGMGIAATISQPSPELDQIELIALPDRRVLMVVVTRDRQVRNRVVHIEETLGQNELTSIRNYVNQKFGGWRLEEVRQELARRCASESAAYDAILRRLTQLYAKGLLDIAGDREVHMEGVGNLVGLDLHLTREKMRELLRALEEKKRIVELIDRFLSESPGGIEVRVGLSEIHPAMGELALIGLPVTLDSGLSAVIAVLGPIRMNYGHVMSAVSHVGEAFQRA